MCHFPKCPTQKAAKDAARQAGKGAPMKHGNPVKGGPSNLAEDIIYKERLVNPESICVIHEETAKLKDWVAVNGQSAMGKQVFGECPGELCESNWATGMY